VDRTPLAGFPVVVEIDVAWGDMDAFGHVNNVVYFRYFEQARLEYFRRLGVFELSRAAGVGPIVQSTQARYRRPLTYPDHVAVGVRVPAVGSDRFTIEHVLVSSRWNAVTAEGSSVVVTFDYDRGVKSAVPDAVRRAIEALEGQPRPPSA
jgi:acyl-CoA thioester hydrolase